MESQHGGGEHTPVFGPRTPQGGPCTACGKPVALNVRRCPACGSWQRPWSVGGKPSRWNHYDVGGSGRPETWGGQQGSHTEVESSVWVRWGPNGEYVKQQTNRGEDARSGAHQPIRKSRKK